MIKVNMPTLGVNGIPSLDRPPSMKNSNGNPLPPKICGVVKRLTYRRMVRRYVK
jgi:hypothetical protein